MIQRPPLSRLLLTVSLLVLIGAMLYAFHFTPWGKGLFENPALRHWIAAHPRLAPLLFLTLYSACGLFGLPVWWLQMLAGYCFGITLGLIWCTAGALAGSALTMYVGHFLFGDYFHRHIEPHAHRLAALDEKLGHNGLLVVTTVRLSNIIPFGLANYAFALTRISMLDVLVGTVMGGTLGKMLYVALGADPRLYASRRFLAVLIVINALLLLPLLLRYLRPAWFRRIGVE